MESDAVPDAPRSQNQSASNKSKSNSNTKKMPSTTGPSDQRACRDVYNFTGASNIHIGHNFHFSNSKKSKVSSSSSKKKKAEIPANVSEVMRTCLDVTEFADITCIKTHINTSWSTLAEKIKTHTNHLENIDRLSTSEAVEEVLLSWIEEHADAALVAILIGNLWELSEKDAACILAEEHMKKKLIY
ncbi:hypothetical protein O3M35_003894 [Rhynocoris fuscipes]|uniref:Death domain-containing protein n=1 Tax=Rhynocoris fuscipes TaxID=488301 RepID=A0AAW1CHQ7_9HEMI